MLMAINLKKVRERAAADDSFTADEVQCLLGEIDRLDEWANGFSDRQLEERRTGEQYQRELNAKIERQRAGYEVLLNEYIAERDCFYDGATKVDGEFPDPDDERIVKEMDAVIDQARTILSVEQNTSEGGK